MNWITTITRGAQLEANLKEGCSTISKSLNGEAPDLIFVFFTPHFRNGSRQLVESIRAYWPKTAIAGCTALGIIGVEEEIEQRPAISLAAAVLPGVELKVTYIDLKHLPDDDAPPDSWRKVLNLSHWGLAEFVILADPFTSSLEALLSGLDYAWPANAKVGGLASGGGEIGSNVLLENDRIHRDGAVVIAMRGNVKIDVVVAQGCRPIGDPLAVSCSNGSLLLELDGKPPVEYLRNLLPRLSDYDRNLLSGSLFMGIQMDELNDEPGSGDYLIRNLLGVDYQSGALDVGCSLHEGQIVQFHLRDKLTSVEDLKIRMDTYCSQHNVSEARGALLFSCMGRGQSLYGIPNHDTSMFAEYMGTLPLAGFFCNGEIGPVAQTSYIHGYTSSFGIFRPNA